MWILVKCVSHFKIINKRCKIIVSQCNVQRIFILYFSYWIQTYFQDIIFGTMHCCCTKPSKIMSQNMSSYIMVGFPSLVYYKYSSLESKTKKTDLQCPCIHFIFIQKDFTKNSLHFSNNLYIMCSSWIGFWFCNLNMKRVNPLYWKLYCNLVKKKWYWYTCYVKIQPFSGL